MVPSVLDTISSIDVQVHVDIFPPATPIVSVIDMFLSRIVPSISLLWQSLLIFVIRKGQCQQAQFSTVILPYPPFFGRVRFSSACLMMMWS